MSSVLARCQDLPERTAKAGEVLLEEGKKAGVLYVLVSGTVEIVKGDVQITTVAEPGSVFGEVSVLLDAPHMATVRALEDSVLYVVGDPLAFLEAQPQIALELARLLARRLHGVTTYLVDLKRQYASADDHLAMVDEVLESLVHHQEAEKDPGSDRYPDPTVD